MKSIHKILSAAALVSLVAVSCNKELSYVPGEAEQDGCYGVFFPEQTIPSEFDPSEDCKITLTAERTNDAGAIEVPVNLEQSDGDVFKVGKISFEDGQTETTFDVTFDDAEIGKEYSFTLSVTDSKYAKVYGTRPTYISASLSRVKWNPVAVLPYSGEGTAGVAKWRDDFVTTIFNVANVEYDVEIQENANTPGLYRLKNVFEDEYPYNEDGDWDDSQDWWIFINATDPAAVYIETQKTGCNWGYGNFVIGSVAGYYLATGKTKQEIAAKGYFGTLSNGIIKFPVGTLLFGMSKYQNGGLYSANNNGMFRVTLPGGKDSDHSFSVSAGLSENGETPVEFKLGEDISSIKYGVFEGSLNSSEIKEAAGSIAQSTEASAVTESGTVNITCKETGVYTIVFLAYDGEELIDYDGESFGYVAAGDEEEKATVVTAGLELTSRYEPVGYDKTNSVLFYVYGKDIAAAKIAIVPTASLKDDISENLAEVNEVGEETLSLINGNGYSDLCTGLKAETDYTLIVWASNGFTETVKSVAVTTEGLANVLLGTGDFTYTSKFLEDDDKNPYVDKGLEIFSNPNFANTYVIEHWAYDTDFTFTYDGVTGKIAIPQQETGYAYSGLPIYVIEYNKYLEYIKYDVTTYGKESSYDPETGTLSFAVAYVVFKSDGSFYGDVAAGVETFVLGDGHSFPASSNGVEKTAVKAGSRILVKGFAGIDVTHSLKAATFSSRFVCGETTVCLDKNAIKPDIDAHKAVRR